MEVMERTIHKLKIEPEYLNALMIGLKTFEIRFDDRDYKVGDILDFGEFSFEVRYIHRGLGMQEGYVAMSVELIGSI